jgi:hypothetical protein
MASQIGHQEIVTLLLAHGADPTIATKVCQRYRRYCDAILEAQVMKLFGEN